MNLPAVSAKEGYERWAPTYPSVPGNPLMRAEQALMLELWPQVAGMRVLDLACGTGRYSSLLQQSGAAQIVALDFSPAMLRRVADVQRVCASMMQLPFAAGRFDAVISGLALGHAPDVVGWLSEIGRVLRSGGILLYSDFHSEAARAGLTRSFEDQDKRSYTLVHHRHELALQREAATAAGLEVAIVREVRVGMELQESFAGSADFYRKWHGLPLVMVVQVRKL